MKRALIAAAILLSVTIPGVAQASAGGAGIAVPVLPHRPSMRGAVDATWKGAERIHMVYDFTYHRNSEPVSISIAQDRDGLDIAFEVRQDEPLTLGQNTNGAGVLSDDDVTAVLWPQGSEGFRYTFTANALGAQYQTSSENSAYSPNWTAVGRRTPHGYCVTMHVPFAIMRTGGSHTWRAQFERSIVATGSTEIWATAPAQRVVDDPAFAGLLTGIAASNRAQPLQPRVQLYGFGQLGAASAGGSTTRVGLDFSLPVTPTSSFIGTVHPDYSNVELDQQTIAPSAFPRRYQEVRPFFTQAASTFNRNFACVLCPRTLYTPAIPAFRQGYAYEGAQGPLHFGVFDTQGTGRTDNGESLGYWASNPHVMYQVAAQRVATSSASGANSSLLLDTGAQDQRSHLYGFARLGSNQGSGVRAHNLATYYEYGVGYADRTGEIMLSNHGLGPQFLPADGFVAQPDVYGSAGVLSKTLTFGAQRLLRSIAAGWSWQRDRDHLGNAAERSSNATLDVEFARQVSAHVNILEQHIRTFDGEFLPFDASGISLGYRLGTSLPASVSYASGAYFHGRLRSWSYLTTLPVSRATRISLETDENAYASALAREPSAKQWLERLSVDWQVTRNASVDFGARRIIGRNIPNAFLAGDLPTPSAPLGTINGYKPFDYVQAGNVTFAFHFLRAHEEYFIAYGDANSLATTPSLFFKWIHYIGGQKGT